MYTHVAVLLFLLIISPPTFAKTATCARPSTEGTPFGLLVNMGSFTQRETIKAHRAAMHAQCLLTANDLPQLVREVRRRPLVRFYLNESRKHYLAAGFAHGFTVEQQLNVGLIGLLLGDCKSSMHHLRRAADVSLTGKVRFYALALIDQARRLGCPDTLATPNHKEVLHDHGRPGRHPMTLVSRAWRPTPDSQAHIFTPSREDSQ